MAVGNMHRVVLLLLLAAHIAAVAGHMFMSFPPARQYTNYKRTGEMGDDAEPMTAYGGRVPYISDNYKLTWPHGHPYSMCGDNTAAKRWMKPGPIVAKWKAGQTITIKTVMWQWHEGRYDFWICKPGTTSLNGKSCRQLWRVPSKADGKIKTKYFYPPRYIPGYSDLRSAVPEMRPKNSFTWKRLPKSGTPFDNFNGTPEVAFTYKLPRGFRCKGCIFVLHYLTGNSCVPPCDVADPEGCSKKMPTCGTPGSKYPEEFWNCADVHVV